ncbi:formate dehydrogenase subunit gamma [Siccirubricoccus sp. G192]|uniref:formate dehydrogenase subunit gamma n=1 Tax=Siccirubricoccus sp. G192 TaxID=2849651 RepID=UPI001C2CBE68|nr:formate dehydrogenase subunit gamma [Siccirubricoccus sp. G192]MBV1799970.1 formate dehydrogenase subunit gamma [Siccirubricoccus sp. G192]
MMRRILPLALLLLAAPAAQAQQNAQEPAAGAPAVQAIAPEVGAGRGGTGGGQQPVTTEPQAPTGSPTPEASQTTPPQPPTPVTPIPTPAPFTDRGQSDAAELELRRALRGGMIEGAVTIPNQTAAVLIQPEGRDWRVFRNSTLGWTGAIAVLGMLAALALFYLLKGTTQIESGRSGRSILRYGGLERANHWMVATSFVLLGLSGLNLSYGRYLLRPLIGAEAFTSLTFWGQAVHQYLSFPFTIGLAVMLAVWLRENLPTRTDLAWLRAGGPMARGHPPAGKFNAGQKLLFWFVIGGGALVAASGYLLMFPFTLTDIAGQQWAHMAHGIMAMLMLAAILAHIYIGTLGTEGAFEGMSSGRVDYHYAKEHHRLWVEQEMAKAQEVVAPPARARSAGAD